ncbi:MAG: AMP-binding protein [bacterium]|nr:AMP-dependent synthetase [Gammaproteobacteria bacterium]
MTNQTTDNLACSTGPTTPPLRDITLGELLKEAADTVPDRIALITGAKDPGDRREWTYADLYVESLEAAHALTLKFNPGERVAVWAPNIPEWIMMEFACAMARVIMVTVNPAFQKKELAYVLKQSRCAGIFVIPEFRGNRMLQAVQEVQGECRDLREVIRLDQWHEFLATADGSDRLLPMASPEDPVMIQYTSGTTGFPKGALLHHKGLVNNGAHTLDRMDVDEGSVWMTYMPLFHTGGCVICVLGAVSKKCTQVLVEMFEPGLVLELIETYGGNAMVGVPTMMNAMLEHPDYESRDLSSVKVLCSGGSTVPAALVEVFEQALGAKFTIVFGQTECSPVSSMTSPEDTTEDKGTTLGASMPHVEVKIIDPESGETLPYGELGEYCTRGYHVMHGYFDMDEATANAIDSEGWLHTGDLCSMDERGYTKVEGRLKDMIIRGGENIYPRELEELLYQHPTIGEVAVVGLPDERMGEIVGAFLRAAPGETLNRETLFAYLREHLSPQKTPARWYELEEFPLTGSGKIQKFELRKQWLDGKFEEMV